MSSREYQKELADFAQSLRAQGIQSAARAFALDACGAVGGLSGEFTLIATTIIKGAAAVAVAWFHARGGRKVRVKYGDMEVEATTLDELKTALHLVEERVRDTTPTK